MNQREIAAQAGVSASTVSRFLRGQMNVSPDTAARIRKALRETPSAPHRRRPSTATIGVIAPSLSNPYFADLADAAATAITEEGHTMHVVLTGSTPAREQNSVSFLVGQGLIDGLLYFGANPDNMELTRLPENDIPIVFLDEILPLEGRRVARVTADNFGGAYQATTHLIHLGHRQIAHLGGPPGLRTADDREQGYRAALQKHSIEINESLILRGPFSAEFGSNFFAHCARADIRPTAVFSASDIAAIGLIEAARTSDVIIPANLSLVGCDGITAAAWTSPRLTTVAQPVQKMARVAVNELNNMMMGASGHDHELPMNLITGDSTARI